MEFKLLSLLNGNVPRPCLDFPDNTSPWESSDVVMSLALAELNPDDDILTLCASNIGSPEELLLLKSEVVEGGVGIIKALGLNESI